MRYSLLHFFTVRPHKFLNDISPYISTWYALVRVFMVSNHAFLYVIPSYTSLCTHVLLYDIPLFTFLWVFFLRNISPRTFLYGMPSYASLCYVITYIFMAFPHTLLYVTPLCISSWYSLVYFLWYVLTYFLSYALMLFTIIPLIKNSDLAVWRMWDCDLPLQHCKRGFESLLGYIYICEFQSVNSNST
jgi:hypothetical protein